MPWVSSAVRTTVTAFNSDMETCLLGDPELNLKGYVYILIQLASVNQSRWSSLGMQLANQPLVSLEHPVVGHALL